MCGWSYPENFNTGRIGLLNESTSTSDYPCTSHELFYIRNERKCMHLVIDNGIRWRKYLRYQWSVSLLVLHGVFQSSIHAGPYLFPHFLFIGVQLMWLHLWIYTFGKVHSTRAELGCLELVNFEHSSSISNVVYRSTVIHFHLFSRISPKISWTIATTDYPSKCTGY